MTYCPKDTLSHLLKHARGFLSPHKALEHWKALVTHQAQLLEAIGAAVNDARWAEAAARFHAAAEELRWLSRGEDPSFYAEIEAKHRRARRPTKPSR